MIPAIFESIVTVAIPTELSTNAVAVTSLPTKSSVVILPAVPTFDPSSLTVIPRMSLAPAVFTGAQLQPPEPFATGTSFAAPDDPAPPAPSVSYTHLTLPTTPYV